jgi:hypothetical protein
MPVESFESTSTVSNVVYNQDICQRRPVQTQPLPCGAMVINMQQSMTFLGYRMGRVVKTVTFPEGIFQILVC